MRNSITKFNLNPFSGCKVPAECGHKQCSGYTAISSTSVSDKKKWNSYAWNRFCNAVCTLSHALSISQSQPLLLHYFRALLFTLRSIPLCLLNSLPNEANNLRHYFIDFRAVSHLLCVLAKAGAESFRMRLSPYACLLALYRTTIIYGLCTTLPMRLRSGFDLPWTPQPHPTQGQTLT
jgi:hypothetical protein